MKESTQTANAFVRGAKPRYKHDVYGAHYTNLRHQAMVEPEFRMILLRNVITAEGEEVRRFRSLKLEFDHLIAFPAVLTVRHRIDEDSPLFGMTP
jgi:hypothetical protein